MPVVLTVAGSDSGGEAGLQADLLTFAALKVHGTTAVTCLTAQNPGRISRIEPCPAPMLRAQLEAVAGHFPIKAAKTGALLSVKLVREVVRFFQRHREIPLVVDPVIFSTSGRALLEAPALEVMQAGLLPLAAVVTPNLAEAETLSRLKIRSLTDLRAAAKKIHHAYGCAVLAKGGHLENSPKAVDVYFGRDGEKLLTAPWVRGARLHGTGCACSAAIAAWMARGCDAATAAERAKKFITARIRAANS